MRDEGLESKEERVQVFVVEEARSYLREQKEEESTVNKTYSQQLDEWVPEDVAPFFGDDEEKVRLHLTPEIAERLGQAAQGPVERGDVIAYYAFVHATREGNYETAGRLLKAVSAPALKALIGDSDG